MPPVYHQWWRRNRGDYVPAPEGRAAWTSLLTIVPDYPRRLPLITLLQSDFINRKGRSRRNSPPFIPRARGEKERRKGGREERRGFIGGGKKLGFSLVAMFKYLKGKIYVSTRGVPFSEDWRDWKRLESLITGRREAVLESQVTVCTSFSFFFNSLTRSV